MLQKQIVLLFTLFILLNVVLAQQFPRAVTTHKTTKRSTLKKLVAPTTTKTRSTRTTKTKTTKTTKTTTSTSSTSTSSSSTSSTSTESTSSTTSSTSSTSLTTSSTSTESTTTSSTKTTKTTRTTTTKTTTTSKLPTPKSCFQPCGVPYWVLVYQPPNDDAYCLGIPGACFLYSENKCKDPIFVSDGAVGVGVACGDTIPWCNQFYALKQGTNICPITTTTSTTTKTTSTKTTSTTTRTTTTKKAVTTQAQPKCIQSCQDSALNAPRYVLVLKTGNTVQCLGPSNDACMWFVDSSCSQNTEGLFPLLSNDQGITCQGTETDGWCGEGINQLIKGKTQSKCNFTPSTTQIVTTAAPSTTLAPPMTLPTWRSGQSYGTWFNTDVTYPNNGRWVYAANFGMSPGAWDNGGALQNTINYCAYTLRSACNIVLPQTGPNVVYKFRSGIYFGSLFDFTLDAGGSTFLFTRDKVWQTSQGSNNPLFQITGSTRLAIKNLVIDWDWTQWRLASLVKLVAATPNQWTVQFLELPQVDLNTIFTFQSFHQTERVFGDGVPGISVEGGRRAMGTRNGAEIYFMGNGISGFTNTKRDVVNQTEAEFRKKYKIPSDAHVVKLEGYTKPSAGPEAADIGTEALGSNIVKINLSSGPGWTPAIGTEFIAKHFVYEIPGISIDSSSHITIENVHIQSTPGKAMTIGTESHHVFLNNFKITLPDQSREGTPRSMSSTADGIAIGGSQGTIKMKNVEIGWNGDDCINLYDPISSDGFAVSTSNTREIYIRESPAWLINYYAGDVLEFFTDSYVSTGFRPKVTYAALYGSTWTVQLSDPIPAAWNVDFINNALIKNTRYFGGNVWIDGLTCRYNRARGILIQVSNVLLENSKFIHNQRAGIVVRASGYWSEGYGDRNVVISNNMLKDVDRMGWQGWNEGGIVMDGERWWEGQGITSSSLHGNIKILNNLIDNVSKKAMTLSSCTGLDVRGNSIISAVDNAPEQGDRGIITVRRMSGVNILNNVFYRLNKFKSFVGGSDVWIDEAVSGLNQANNPRTWL